MTNVNRISDLQLRSTYLEIDQIVGELRTLRIASLEHRQGHKRPPKLPSRKILVGVAEGLSAAMFPNRLGSADLADEGVDHYVGHTLNTTLRALLVQIQHELHFNSGLESLNDEDRERAVEITQAFAKRLPAIRSLLETDIVAAYEGDPAAHSVDEVLVCYPGIMAITYYRLAHELHLLGVPLIARMISEIAHSSTGIEIHPGARIGGSFFIDHGTGVVIGETAIIGRNVRLYQAVTLGAKRFPVDEHGALVKGIPRHPIVEDDVVIYAGATILGRITIGRGSTIGGNVWLTRSVPPGSHITQAQIRHETFEGGAGI
ncbi:MAG TPA: serine acetyltransferase [Nitrosomonas nitrosa]|uniref:serine O-acetyltransferase n=1 Tax=Nitrosomonas nitrosa TaxID=52442 RepID=A0A8H8Z0K0_9PROT|nr:serine acetyltransferase [Nitrosomonas nitrosa]PTR00207.1 serine O-acetyltransferase [Nitrosomonas nitrosa]CAE6508907.1 Serine acetyltransferase, plasmid [Nitrosomonas nitrosa]HBZ30273.1 serine acetyltransferase [Nitrosomonas nitrosa]